MKARYLYNARAELEFCSMEDLQKFFEKECGTPSPKEETEVNSDAVQDFVKEKVYNIRVNSPAVADKIYYGRVQYHAAICWGIEDAFIQ